MTDLSADETRGVWRTSPRYPFIRVAVAFSLCPLLVATVWVLLTPVGWMVASPEARADSLNPSALLASLPRVWLTAAYIAMRSFFLPAAVAAVLYLPFRPYRTWRTILVVSLIGALIAYLWGQLLSFSSTSDLITPALGAASSFTMALLALPRKR